MRFIDELEERGLLFDVTDPAIGDFLENEKATLYLGTDPTGDSLHVGHLAIFLLAKRLQLKGHKVYLLVGGATGQIGDPKEQGERKMLDLSVTNKNLEALTAQVKKIFGIETVLNNYDWISQIDVITFLREYGKNFNVNYMINKDTVKSRLDSGISYTEFSYQILQSLDWHHLYTTLGVNMQIGGQDQWGNITAGSELIRKKCGPEAKVYGLTMPLITRLDGTKYGKSEAGESVWLDGNKTSPYAFYQFWINTSDAEVIKRLKQFTFLSLDEINEIEKEWSKAPEQRYAQKRLAEEVTTFIHGESACDKAIKISEALFSGEIKDLTADEIEMGFGDLPSITLTEMSLVEALIQCGLASSKREAREFITNGAVTLNGTKEQDVQLILTKELAIEERFIVLRRGKKKYALVRF